MFWFVFAAARRAISSASWRPLHCFSRTVSRKSALKPCNVQADSYQKVLASLRGIQRTTHCLLSIQGLTNFLECDSFLRRYYQYGTGLPSQLFGATRHYENTRHECKSWVARACKSCLLKNQSGFAHANVEVPSCATWGSLARLGDCTSFLHEKAARLPISSPFNSPGFAGRM